MPDTAPTRSRAGIRLRIDQTVGLGRDGRAVPVSPLEQAYLLLLQQAGQRGIGREEVFSLLWGIEDSGASRHRLRQLNYTLKRKGGAPVVETQGSVVRLAQGVAVDWGRDPAWESFPAPTPAFEDRIEGMRGARERAAAREVVHELETARLTDAPERLLRFLARGHTSPTAWRDTLWALLRTGRIREAEFELRRAFGDRVPPEGLSLGRRLASHASKLLNTAATGGELSIPLIGRNAEAQRLNALLAQETPSILLTGVHGAGRSRLLGQAVATLLTGEEDVVVLSARGEGDAIERPFGGLTQLLSEETLPQAHDELGQPDHEVLSRALPVHFESRGPHHLAQIGGPGSYLRVARAVEALFQRAFGAADVVLCVDDLHAIDRSTLEVIAFLLRDQAVRLLGSWCTEEPGTSTELLLRVQNLKAQLVPLTDLEVETAARFARAVDPGISDEQSVEIARVAGGRPGRIVDLIKALGGGGLPQTGRGPSLDGLLRARVREMGAAEQEVLILLAVNRGRLSVEALARLLGAGMLEAAGYARALEESGLVRIDPDETAVVPGLMRDFINRELPSSVREKTHLRIAQALEESGSDDYASIGHHRLAAGRPTEAAEWFQRAAASAKDQTAYAEAIALLEKSIAAADEYDPDLGGDLGRLYFGMGDFQNSIHSYQRARAEYAHIGRTVPELRCLLGEIATDLEAGVAKAELLAAHRTLLLRARQTDNIPIVADAIDLWLRIGDYHHDKAQVQAARTALLQLANVTSHPAVDRVGARLAYLGEPQLGLQYAKRAYLRSKRNATRLPTGLNRLISCLHITGRSRTRLAVVLRRRFELEARSRGDLPERFDLYINLGLWHTESRDWNRARECFRLAESLMVATNLPQQRVLAINRAVLGIRSGKMDFVQEQLIGLDEYGPSTRQDIHLLSLAVRTQIALHRQESRMVRTWIHQLADVDLDFPFSSDLSLIPETLATFHAQAGHYRTAVRIVRDATKRMAPHNASAGVWLQRRLDGLQRAREGSPT